MHILTSWSFWSTKRDILSCDILPPDSQIWCAFAVPFFRNWNNFSSILCHHTVRGREFPWWRREVWETHASNLVREIYEESWIVARDWMKLVGVRKFYNAPDFVMPWSGEYEAVSYCAIYALVTSTPLVEWTASKDEISDVVIVSLDDYRLDQLTPWNRIIYEQAWSVVRETYII